MLTKSILSALMAQQPKAKAEHAAPAKPSYIFGGTTGLEYEDLQRQKRQNERLLAQLGRAPRNVGEGLNALGAAIGYRMASKRTTERENEILDALRASGYGATPKPHAAPASSPAPLPDIFGSISAPKESNAVYNPVPGIKPEFGEFKIDPANPPLAPDGTFQISEKVVPGVGIGGAGGGEIVAGGADQALAGGEDKPRLPVSFMPAKVSDFNTGTPIDAPSDELGVQELATLFQNPQFRALYNSNPVVKAQIDAKISGMMGGNAGDPVKGVNVGGNLVNPITGELIYEGAAPIGPNFETEQKLRKEFDGLSVSKDFSTINDAYDKIFVSAENPSAAGDLALVFNYMKMLDPGSVVRESEFATAENAAGVDERVRNLYNKLLTGEKLAPEQRLDFVTRAGQLFNAQAGNYNDKVKRYRELAEAYGTTPDNIAKIVELVTTPPEIPPFDESYREFGITPENWAQKFREMTPEDQELFR